MRKLFLLMLMASVPVSAHAQTFDLDQFDQLFRPRLRMEGRWLPPVGSEKGPGTYEDRSALAILTFPIHSTFKVNAQLDLTADSWKDLLTNTVRVHASQVMVNVRLGTREVRFDEAFGKPRLLHSASIGARGVSLTKRLRILFWSANVNISEEDRTLDRSVPRFGGMFGKMKVKGLRRQFFYGFTANYSDGFALPVPFIGGSAPMGKKWSFNYVLPLQLSLGWKVSGKLRLAMGAGLAGYRSGMELDVQRFNFNYLGLRTFVGVRQKLNKYLALKAEAGYTPFHRISFGTININDVGPPVKLDHCFNFMVGVNIFFGHSTLDRILDEVLKF